VHASTSAAAFKACPIAASKPFSNATLREATNFASSLHLPSQQKQTRTTAASYMKSSVDLQSSLGDTLQQLLTVEHERLAVERERLAVERERLDIEKSQLQVNIARYNLKLGVVGELVVPQMQ
jgi:sporulation-control protein spo0M